MQTVYTDKLTTYFENVSIIDSIINYYFTGFVHE